MNNTDLRPALDDLLTLIFRLELWARTADKTAPAIPANLRQQMQAALDENGPFQARIFLRDHAPAAATPALDTDSLLHAAFIMEGVCDMPAYNAMLEKWGQGCIELVADLMRYVPVLHAAMLAADNAGAEYAGVFDYEVSADFGGWCGNRVLQTGALPPHNECVGYISGSARRFFQQADLTSTTLHAIRVAVEAFSEPQGGQP